TAATKSQSGAQPQEASTKPSTSRAPDRIANRSPARGPTFRRIPPNSRQPLPQPGRRKRRQRTVRKTTNYVWPREGRRRSTFHSSSVAEWRWPSSARPPCWWASSSGERHDGRECVVADFETAGRSTARDDLREKPAL